MDLEAIKNRKKELGLTNAALAELSGVSLGSVNKILSGAGGNPRVKTLKALEAALGLEENKSSRFWELNETCELQVHEETVYNAKPNASQVHEETAYNTNPNVSQVREGAVYKVKKTVRDIEALPEDVRVELIDGVIYDMAAPTWLHQRIVGYIFHRIYSYIEGKGGPCVPMISPLDVQLDMDDYTIVQPDVLILCDPKKNIKKRVYGAPDWVMETVSPSSKYKDYILKAAKYMNAGVKEYWIVDSTTKKVTVYTKIDENFEMKVYQMTEPVPVGIYSDLSIDLSWVMDEEE